MIEDPRDRLVELGYQKAGELLNDYGNRICPACGHSNWAHGEGGCVHNPCPCREGKSNEEIIFGMKQGS